MATKKSMSIARSLCEKHDRILGKFKEDENPFDKDQDAADPDGDGDQDTPEDECDSKKKKKREDADGDDDDKQTPAIPPSSDVQDPDQNLMKDEDDQDPDGDDDQGEPVTDQDRDAFEKFLGRSRKGLREDLDPDMFAAKADMDQDDPDQKKADEDEEDPTQDPHVDGNDDDVPNLEDIPDATDDYPPSPSFAVGDDDDKKDEDEDDPATTGDGVIDPAVDPTQPTDPEKQPTGEKRSAKPKK